MRYAFAAEARGEMPKGTGRRWAHRWKCWTKPGASLTAACADAMRILDRVSKKTKVVPIGIAVKPKKRHRKVA